jgi:hypothetical protein
VGHPIKTFSNISSGKVESDDKIIFASESVFDSVRWEEIKRHAQTFNSNEFDNIFRSTLELESQNSGAILLNFQQKEILPVQKKEKAKIENFFGLPEKKEPLVEKKPKLKKDPQLVEEEEKKPLLLETKTPPDIHPEEADLEAEKNNSLEKLSPFEMQREIFIKSDDEVASSEKKQTQTLSKKIDSFFSSAKDQLKKKTWQIKPKFSSQKNKAAGLLKKMFDRFNQRGIKKIGFGQQTQSLKENKSPLKENIASSDEAPLTEVSKNNLAKMFENFLLKTKGLWNENKERLHFQKKYIVVATMLFIMFAAVVFLGARKNKEPLPLANNENTESPQSNDAQQESSLSLEELASFDSQFQDMAFLNNSFFVLTQDNTFFEYNSQNKENNQIELPKEIGNIKAIAQMPSLNLIFLVAPPEVYSYSPITKKFETNKIDLPSNMDVVSAKTYLTYIYILDQNNNQIFQYPRAAGGFGQRKDWLKQEISLDDSVDMAINGSIYISKQDQIKKYFLGKEEAFTSPLDLKNAYIWAEKEETGLALLDSEKGELVLTDKDGQITKSITDQKFVGAKKGFWFDEQNKLLYFIDKDNRLQKTKVE